MELDYEKLLDEFIREEHEKVRIGSGDDGAYVIDIDEYIIKQRPFWITFIKFIENKLKLSAKTKSTKHENCKTCYGCKYYPLCIAMIRIGKVISEEAIFDGDSKIRKAMAESCKYYKEEQDE